MRIDWSNAETLWLNITNIGLGIGALVLFAVLVVAVLTDMLGRVKHPLHGGHRHG